MRILTILTTLTFLASSMAHGQNGDKFTYCHESAKNKLVVKPGSVELLKMSGEHLQVYDKIDSSNFVKVIFKKSTSVWYIGNGSSIYAISDKSGKLLGVKIGRYFSIAPDGALKIFSQSGSNLRIKSNKSNSLYKLTGRLRAVSSDGKWVLSFDEETFQHSILNCSETGLKKVFVSTLNHVGGDQVSADIESTEDGIVVFSDGASFGSSNYYKLNMDSQAVANLFSVASSTVKIFDCGKESVLFGTVGGVKSVVCFVDKQVKKIGFISTIPELKYSKYSNVMTYKNGRWITP